MESKQEKKNNNENTCMWKGESYKNNSIESKTNSIQSKKIQRNAKNTTEIKRNTTYEAEGKFNAKVEKEQWMNQGDNNLFVRKIKFNVRSLRNEDWP